LLQTAYPGKYFHFVVKDIHYTAVESGFTRFKDLQEFLTENTEERTININSVKIDIKKEIAEIFCPPRPEERV
jgi:hypothetical protein